MDSGQKAKNVISRALKKVNEVLPLDQQLQDEGSTPLFGAGSPLDSLGRVNLIVALEEQVSQDLGVDLGFMDELTNPTGILDTVGSLHKVLQERVGAN